MQEDSGGAGLLRTLALVVEAIWPSYVRWQPICDMMIDPQPFETLLRTSVVERNFCRHMSQGQAWAKTLQLRRSSFEELQSNVELVL